MPELEPVIGLEVHAQLRTATKIFCGCAVRFGAPPNSLTCPVCLGMPGALPVLNRQAVALALKCALAMGSRILRSSTFARKNYFYPDLPKGYQISQFDLPLAEGGALEIEVDGVRQGIALRRIHMEEDAGKLVHEGPAAVPDATLVDLNRSGVPLIEIVGEPQLGSPEDAYAYLTALKSILTYTEVCDGNMEEGSLRCDANVSLREKGSTRLGTRVELKNLNSFRNVERALRYEIQRQEALLHDGGRVVQQTLLYDADAGETRPMRSKEEAHDYRYFPDPDLLPLVVSEAWIDELRASLPELPSARKDRFVLEYGLGAAEAQLLTLEKPLADWFEAAVRGGIAGAAEAGQARASGPPLPAKDVAKKVLREIMAKMKEEAISSERLESRYPSRFLASLVRLQLEGAISAASAAKVFEVSWQRAGENAAEERTAAETVTPAGSAGAKGAPQGRATPGMAGRGAAATAGSGSGSPDPAAIATELGLGQISDESAVLAAVEGAIAANPGQVQQYRAGKQAVYGYLVGQVMKATDGRANPALVNRLLKERLAVPQ